MEEENTPEYNNNLVTPTSSAMAPKILFVFTSNDKLVNTDKKTGWYLPEAAHPYYVLKEAGYELVAASENGGE